MDCNDWSKMVYVAPNKKVPEISCIYFLMNDIELVYIGQTKNLRSRMRSHNVNFRTNIEVGGKKTTQDLYDSVYYLSIVDDKKIREELEQEFILAFEPKLNWDAFDLRMFLPIRHTFGIEEFEID